MPIIKADYKVVKLPHEVCTLCLEPLIVNIASVECELTDVDPIYICLVCTTELQKLRKLTT